ncbi:MAG: M48 family metalloprotease [Aquabacterium sp.]|uniref:M48 family metallopeptidase n=1 Tax=Aquabacterium sp. TaxID=1872578 RepID=UPI0025C3DCA5|nr:M48 family metallopeptidase [Aquabacterium sp.]MBI3380769.1 M48 family metalloprotease [Aquabacterium sp.]
MEQAQFEKMVAELERDSVSTPRMYQFKVAMLAALGFVVLAAVLGLAGAGIVVLGGIAVVFALTGGSAAILVLKLGKLLVLLAWPLWLLVKSSVSALLVRLPAPQGHEITRPQAPALFSALEEMRRRMKGSRFHHVLITNEVNAAVVQRPLFGLVGWPRNYLILGLPLLESLSPQEALAVVAHEYGHLAGSHSRFAGYIYRLRNSWGVIQELAHRWQGWASGPLQRLVGWYAPYFNAYTFVLARTNEYQADAASAELVGAGVAADALKRVHLTTANYGQFMERVFAGVREQAQPPSDLTVRWSEQATQLIPTERATAWLSDALARQSDVADTHPALKQRLQALLPGVVDHHDQVPAPIGDASAAREWLGAHVTPLRDLIQRDWRERVAQYWGQRHEEVQVQRERLAALLAVAQPSRDEAIETIRLRLQLEPDEDHLAALQGFNQQYQDHALGLFLEGDYLLGKGDEAGLAVLERAMALDPAAVKPGCESAYAFLKKRQDHDRAQTYGDRWAARDLLERKLDHERANLDVTHELRGPDELAPPELERAASIVRTLGAGVKRAYFARRVLPSDPGHATYVLAVELNGWARLRKQHAGIVQRFAQQEWPVHVLICTVHGRYAPLKAALKRLPRRALLLGPGGR